MNIGASTKKVIINGDDFGISDGVNRAIIEAHTQGILTSTSLMVTGVAFKNAVTLAKTYPHLGVGLHLVLVCGKSVLPHQKIPNLVNEKGDFSNNPVLAGLNYQFYPGIKQQLRQEIKAQLDKFQQTGLTLTHVDGHLHLHVHPVILEILVELAEEYQIKYIRLPYEEFSFTRKITAKNRLIQKMTAITFESLRLHGYKRLKDHNISTTERVYGLLATGEVTETYLLNLIPQIQANFVEIYSHPSESESGNLEKLALMSPKVKNQLNKYGFQLTNYLAYLEKNYKG